ncbi:MAG: F0F1 ATP synthase subunit epsilon [Nitrospirota bacterium]
MRLRIFLPTEVLIDQDVDKVIAEAENGSFCIEPRHIDFVAALVPGIFLYQKEDSEVFVAVNDGVLVKRGLDVLVSTRNAVKGTNLGKLREQVQRQFLSLDDIQRAARSAVARLEAGFVRRFIELGEDAHE